MGEDGVGVLEEGDEHEPVVHPQIWHEVGQKHVSESTRIHPVREADNPEQNANNGYNDLREFMRLE